MSTTHMTRGTLLAFSLIAALGACSKKDAGTADTGMVATTDTGMAATTPTPAAPASTLSDANIVYMLDHANMLDSSGGAIASKKGTNAEVREFATMMMRDHHQLRQQGQDLAKKLAVTPEAPPNDSSQAQTDRTMTLLNGAAKGKDFDKAYIDNEVAAHKSVLEMATTAMNAAQNAELKNLIQKAAPAIQAHLDRAQAIQSKLQ
jgi:putative membrane protein